MLVGAAFHPSLEDQDGGHAIHRLASFFNGKIGFAQQAVGFGRGEALVPQVDGEFEMLAQILGKSWIFSAWAPSAPLIPRGRPTTISFTPYCADHSVKVGEVVLLILPVQRIQTLSRHAQRVGNSNSDAAQAYIESEYAGFRDAAP